MIQRSASFRIGLRAQLSLLKAAQEANGAGQPAEASDSLVRLAHQLAAVARSSRAPALARAAEAVEKAEPEELTEALQALITEAEAVVANDDDPPLTVLFLEDDPDLGFLLQRSLTELGVVPLFAGTIAEARKQVAEKDIDLVLMDLGLPDDDGRTLLAWLREQPLTEKVPILVLTSNRTALTKQECFALGADEYLEKPFDLDVLAATISRHLARSEERVAELRRDPLTGLPNQAAIREEYRRVLEMSIKAGSPLCFALIEIDGFAALRTKHGRALTNEAMMQVVGIVKSALTPSDLLGLWEPGELVVLLAGRGQVEGARILEGVRQKLVETDLEVSSGARLPLVFSAGVVDLYRGMMIEECHAMASRLLYVASVRGGSGVLCPE